MNADLTLHDKLLLLVLEQYAGLPTESLVLVIDTFNTFDDVSVYNDSINESISTYFKKRDNPFIVNKSNTNKY